MTSRQLYEHGLQLYEAGQFGEAERVYRQFVAEQPEHAGGMILLGVTLYRLGRLEEAIKWYRKAIVLRADVPEAHNNLGAALRDLGRPAEAIEAYRKAVALRPDYAEAIGNLGGALREMGKLDEAIEACRRALALRPDHLEVCNDLGSALYQDARLDEAMEVLSQLLAARPDDWKGWNNIAATYRDRGQVGRAIECYDRILAAQPGNASVASNRLYLMNFLPAHNITQVFEEHREWDRRFAQPLAGFREPHQNDRSPDRPLRIGYVSSDFRLHSVAFFLLPLLQAHNRERFHLTCYGASPKRDFVTEEFRACSDRWVDLNELSDDKAAQRIREDGIDILVDVSGHTSGNRLLLFAREPAPIQVTYLGYPNTTGMSAIGWRITDDVTDPPGADELHTERLVRLPRTAWCFRPLSGSPAVVQSERAGVTFGSFNDLAKVNRPLLDLWGRILKEVKGSRLILKNRATGSESVRKELESRGIEVIPHQRSSEAHLQCYHQLDIALDTFPYHGTTTTCEAMWMGAPVITMAGKTHVSRVGTSLLGSVGLGDLIAGDEDEYVRLAVELAANRSRRAELRFGLRDRMKGSPLMDSVDLARNIESGYRMMWDAWLKR